MPIQMTSQGEIFYASRGQAAHVVLCVHGAGGNHAHWNAVLVALASSARVITLDLPGHGRSPGAGRQQIAAYAAAALALLDALQIGQATVIGHSMGGAIALQMALDQPERVCGIGLVASGARLRVLPALLTGLAEQPVEAIDMLVATAYASHAAPALRERARREYLGCAAGVVEGDFVACDQFDVRDRLGELHGPCVVVTGAEDRLTPPRSAERLAAAIAHARLHIIAAAGHMVMIEQPAATATALRQ